MSMSWLAAIFNQSTKPEHPLPEEPVSQKVDRAMAFLQERTHFREGGPGEMEIIGWWKYSRWCKSYKSIIGATYAWCGITQAAAEDVAGRTWPLQCETASKWIGHGSFWDWQRLGLVENLIVVIQHKKSGGYHVTRVAQNEPAGFSSFLGLGGNQNNGLNVTRYDLNNERILWVGRVG